MSSAAPRTADLYDAHEQELQASDAPLRDYGGRSRFFGTIRTVRCHEDNALLRRVLSEPGEGRVLVVDGGGSLQYALVGDVIAGMAASNGWAGLIIWGAVRDVAALAALPIGVKARGSTPRKSSKRGEGAVDVPVGFGGVVFVPGGAVYCDEDGVVVAEHLLTL